MTTPATPPRKSRAQTAAFLAGVLTTCIIFALVIAFIGYRTGYSALFNTLRGGINPQEEEILYLPDNILKELIEKRAVVDNAGNPTKQLSHYTILVDRDEEVGWSLIPNAHIALYMLKARNSGNFGPPVLALPADADLSDDLKQYIKEQARLHYTYNVGPDGYRVTVPDVQSDHKILMVGDSVLFGLGVNDDVTMASYLQRKVGNSFRVVNTGVGGFSGEQALQMANKAARKDNYEVLIYIACQNDFMLSPEGVPYSVQAQQVLKKYAAVKDKFGGKVVVMLMPYMEYALDDILRKGGWYREMVAEMDRLRREMPVAAKELGLEYFDMTDVMNDYTQENGTIMARFALFADNAHLSPLGNRLAAEKLYESLKKIEVIR
jgi:lysophospholipase L1-like esterase